MFPIAPAESQQDLGYLFWRAFSGEEIDRIVALGDAKEKAVAQVGGAQRTDDKVRRSKIAWLPTDNPEYHWLYERCTAVVRQANGAHYHFDLTGFVDALQFTVYDAEDGAGGHYDWHIDPMGRNAIPRKLSMIVQLSDPFDYDGGEVQLWGADRVTLPKERGLIHFFPSWTLHRVTPVTRGIRKSLVAWISGPDWR